MINYFTEDDKNCTTKKDMEVAREVAEYLKIPFFTFDYVKEYDDIILRYIYEGYQK
jgi:tRNA U34 2-thiouridine synthase MnmA/TrmU